MALGYATHLWLHGVPSEATLRGWVQAGFPEVREDDLVALRLGGQTLLCAVNTSDGDWRSRSRSLISSLRPDALDWTFVDLRPDACSWHVSSSAGDELSCDGDAEPPTEDVDQARALLQAQVPLALAELHHYVEWAHDLEACAPGSLAPGLPETRVEPLVLGLPAGPDRSPSPLAQATSAAAHAGEALADVAVRTFGLALLLPYLGLGLAGPAFAWWYLLGGLLEGGTAGFVTVAILEAMFALPFTLTWKRMPGWARALVVTVHVLALVVGLARARLASS